MPFQVAINATADQQTPLKLLGHPVFGRSFIGGSAPFATNWLTSGSIGRAVTGAVHTDS